MESLLHTNSFSSVSAGADPSPSSSISSHGDCEQYEDLPDTLTLPSSPPLSTASHQGCDGGRKSDFSASGRSIVEQAHVEYQDHHGNDDVESICSSTVQYCQEQFDAYKIKVIQLCHDVGLGEPSEIERMEGGSFNRVVGLTFPSADKPQYVLRVPRYALNEEQAKDIKDQVSVQLHLSKYDSLPVATAVAYDSTTENAINCQYVLQERLHGESICGIFYGLPLSEKLQITTKVAEMILNLESIVFDRPGRLIGADNIPASSAPSAKLVAGITVSGFRDHPMFDGPALEKQPLVSLIWALLEHRKEVYDDMPHLVERCERLQEVAKEMQSAGLMRVADNDSVLWHWDLSASNILARQINASPIVDVTISRGQGSRILLDKSDNHKSVLSFHETDNQGVFHNVRVETECHSSTSCQHAVEVKIEDDAGHAFHHTAKFAHHNRSGKEILINTHNKSTSGGGVPNYANGQQESSETKDSLKGDWELSGILDWDDVLAVPLVLSRKPPSWLWLNEHDRASSWCGDRDEKPQRDLTGDELLIKAHFDQVMTRASPTWMDDAYGRGVWLRALARYGLYPFEDGLNYSNYDDFIAAWDGYFQSVAR
ncbi:hypothetical protein ONS95_012362 [Cadophora gregata]|uniref:uncharacterized protein n=1 Tax=Cadophora gregata TaxID=51156 RepID=UPI0026DB4BC7|nr:uncharacterized protein ONS95_012362 [Cadophora gregata]KAK0118053.1 hypothetical protein ONS95_012362 [Cadophora gregata]KAK0123123.1 hypothetical protein ONS96_010127 [Cadophora gregata f. sp. sojae]